MPKKKMPAMPLFVDRWLTGTRMLGENSRETLMLKGAYLDLLLYLFDRRTPIKDADHVARILGVDKRLARNLWRKLEHKFLTSPHGSTHGLVTEILKNSGRIKGLGEEDSPQYTHTVPVPVPDKRSSNEDLSSAEPKSAPADAPNLPACPHQKIIDLYHEICPTMRRVRTWQGQRPKYLQQRWREHPNLDWWKGFLSYCAESEFLTGRTNGFCADLEWLIRPNNFQKVNEGKYHGRRGPIQQTKPRAEQFNADGTRKRELTH